MLLGKTVYFSKLFVANIIVLNVIVSNFTPHAAESSELSPNTSVPANLSVDGYQVDEPCGRCLTFFQPQTPPFSNVTESILTSAPFLVHLTHFFSCQGALLSACLKVIVQGADVDISTLVEEEGVSQPSSYKAHCSSEQSLRTVRSFEVDGSSTSGASE